MEPPADYVNHEVEEKEEEGSITGTTRDREGKGSEIYDKQRENQDSEAQDDATSSGRRKLVEGGSSALPHAVPSKSSIVALKAVAAAPAMSQFQQTKRRSNSYETAVETYGADLDYKDQVASVAAPGPGPGPGPVNAAHLESADEALLLQQKKRRSTPHEIAMATGGVGLDYKDQVASEELTLQAARRRDTRTKADRNQPILQPYSRIRNGDNENLTVDQSHDTCDVIISPIISSNSGNIDDTGRIGNAIQADVAETDHELRQRIFQDAVSADVVHVEPLSRRKWFGGGLLVLFIAVVVVVAVSVSTLADNESSSTTSIGTPAVPSTPTASPTVTVSPTNAPSPRPPADLVLQLVVGGSDTRNPDVLLDAISDGALVDVDEVGTESFAIIATAADVVEAVEFDTGERESTRPFSRCGDVNARNLIKPCEDLVSPGIFTVWATPLGAKDEDGERIPWPTVTVTFELIGKLG